MIRLWVRPKNEFRRPIDYPRAERDAPGGNTSVSANAFERWTGCLVRKLAGDDIAAIDESLTTEIIDPVRGVGATIGRELIRTTDAVEVASEQALKAAEERPEDARSSDCLVFGSEADIPCSSF